MVLLEDAVSRDVLRVVQYERFPPVLEKRHQYFHRQSRRWRNGKVRGMTGWDFAQAVQHMEEFEAALLAPWRSPRAGMEGDGDADSPPAQP